MIIKTAEFVVSNPNYKNCPKSDIPEYAFIGRSNVGKSSLINLLTNNKHLAKTSTQPGKTQLINHFIINNQWYIVDLPGYGYAKVSKEKLSSFSEIITGYLTNRDNLFCVFVLIDSRLEPQQIDLDFIDWLGSHQIAFAIVFTKSDKLNKNDLNRNTDIFKKTLLQSWETLPTIFITSATDKIGKDEILEFIEKTNNSWKSEVRSPKF